MTKKRSNTALKSFLLTYFFLLVKGLKRQTDNNTSLSSQNISTPTILAFRGSTPRTSFEVVTYDQK